MKLFAVTGNPIAFSKSPNIFNTFFKINSDNAKYFLLSAETAKEAITVFNELELSGMSVTSPFKADIMQYLDEIDDIAKSIGSVNTIVRKNNKLIGYNTDYNGIIDSLPNVNGKNILLLGAGGAAKAVAFSLKQNGANITIVNRTNKKAQELAEKFNVLQKDVNDIESIINTTDIIINTIPNGVKLIKDKWLKPNHIIFDAIYNNPVYKEIAKQKSREFIDGKKWLLNQAIPAYKLFINKDIEVSSSDINFESKPKDKIILVGFMGSGKSTIAEKLSEKLNIKHFSTDVVITVREGLSINEIFEKHGEQYFRDTEEQILNMLCSMAGKGIISTGGGVVLSEKNRKIIAENYKSIWLYANTETIMSRTKPDNRPLLKDNFTKERVSELMNERKNYYTQSADILINTSNKTIDEVIDILLTTVIL